MNTELGNKLVAAYPKMFPEGNFYFECGDGWYEILDTLCRRIQAHIDNREESIKWAVKSNARRSNPYGPHEFKVPESVPQVTVAQIKQKFAGLRFYYDGGDETIDGMVQMAESWAYRTCETCGNPGKQVGRSWIYISCDEHIAERDRVKEDEV